MHYDSLPKSVIRRPRHTEVSNDAVIKITEQPPKLVCCHGDLSRQFVSIDNPWFSFLYAIAHGKILHEPPHALERLGPLMRRTDFIIRVESPFIVVFLVQSLDEYGSFVEIDRQSRWELTAAELPEWLQGIFIPDAGKVLEWKCRNHGNSFRCTVFMRKAMGLSWW
ncbi:hypothetical protein SBOR_6270 [Sclerotinia borealis F-4128]|uniref:Uncharacterized protein n=1 Tax=Sclerotinia borealis (strain F-4128) TaxID=1432307 RepID=W9CC13_SCLBF|nr:hypothetical protein SBOR_6270 [Sclerotinia borealis F-4128]